MQRRMGRSGALWCGNGNVSFLFMVYGLLFS
jgi:hypothetical protein